MDLFHDNPTVMLVLARYYGLLAGTWQNRPVSGSQRFKDAVDRINGNPVCYIRPAATPPNSGGYQVWHDDGTAFPVYRKQ